MQDLIDGVEEQLVGDTEMQQAAEANTKENFRYVFEKALDAALLDRHAKHGNFIDKVLSDADMLKFFRSKMLDKVYERLRPGPDAGGSR